MSDPQEAKAMQKTLKPSWVYAMALGSEVGWGAFILPFAWLTQSGLGGVTLGFLIACVLILVIGSNYGRAIGIMPATGGGVYYAVSAGGRVSGLLSGWALVLAYTSIVALNASAITLVFRVLLPDLTTKVKLYDFAGSEIFLSEILISLTFILVFTLLNLKGFSFSGRFQFGSVILLLSAVLLVTVSSIYKFFSSGIQMAPLFPGGGFSWTPILLIVAIAPWAYIGFDTVPQLAGEFGFKPSKAGGMIALGIVSATLVYISMTFATAVGVGTSSSEYEAHAWPPAQAIGDTVGKFAVFLMVIAVFAGVLTGLNGFIAAASRVLYTMASLKMISPRFAQLSGTNGTPRHAIVFVGLVSAVTPFFGRSTLTWIVDMSSLGIVVGFFFTSLFIFKYYSGQNLIGIPLRQRSVSFTGRVLGFLGSVISIIFLALLLIPGMPSSLGVESVIALGLWICISAMLAIAHWKTFAREPITEKIFDLWQSNRTGG